MTQATGLRRGSDQRLPSSRFAAPHEVAAERFPYRLGCLSRGAPPCAPRRGPRCGPRTEPRTEPRTRLQPRSATCAVSEVLAAPEAGRGERIGLRERVRGFLERSPGPERTRGRASDCSSCLAVARGRYLSRNPLVEGHAQSFTECRFRSSRRPVPMALRPCASHR